MIIAKMTATVREDIHDEKVVGERIELNAVYSEDIKSENYSFSQSTPSATLNMYISNPSAFGFFKTGKEYFIKFLPATA